MDMGIIVGIIAIVLLIVVIVLIIVGKKPSVSTEVEEISRLIVAGSNAQREAVIKQIADGTNAQFDRFGVIQSSIQSTLQGNREETTRQLQGNREESLKQLQGNREESLKQLQELSSQLDLRLQAMSQSNAQSIEKVNATLEAKMDSIQQSNEKRLEQMQGVVDEKLQKTLESRLSQSFELVSKQLDSVQQGLGEMKNLAADAKSLKNALTNVKERGTYGEVRLERLLSDILTSNQYVVNAEITLGKHVEFAVKLPGSDDAPLLLPIDSKFPIEDYNRLLDAEDKLTIEAARRSLTAKIRTFAKDMAAKYIMPPKTTDFALMFLPTEGLYAEVVRNAALFEELRDKYKVTAVGATTLSAFLSSLQMGFKTLAIEQRSQEVWETLRAVKAEFGKFGAELERAQKQIQSVDKTIGEIAGVRTRAINRALRKAGDIDSMPALPADTATGEPPVLLLEED